MHHIANQGEGSKRNQHYRSGGVLIQRLENKGKEIKQFGSRLHRSLLGGANACILSNLVPRFRNVFRFGSSTP